MPDERLQRMSRDIFLGVFGDLGEVGERVVERAVLLMDERAYVSGETMFEEGWPSEHIYLMREGTLRMSQSNGVTWRVQGRWVNGFHDVVLSRPYSSTAVAESDMRVLELRASPWLELLEDCFDLTKRALEGTAGTVAELDERLASPPPTPHTVATKSINTLVDKLSFMLDVRMLRGAGVQALADLATTTSERVFSSGELILSAGVERKHLHFVVSGDVHARNETKAITRTYRAGDLICGAAAFGPLAPQWDASATTTVEVLSLPIDVWYDAMEEHFDLARAALEALALRRQLLIETLAAQSDLVLR